MSDRHGPHLEIITTGDGSPTLYDPALDETYHSRHGALRESKHVFIDHGLSLYCAMHPGIRTIRMFELGFGTGLNALLSLRYASDSRHSIEYTSVEPRPLPIELTSRLDFAAALGWENGRDVYAALHRAPWSEVSEIIPGFVLHKVPRSLEEYTLPGCHFHVAFYDAFAPSRQPEVWSLENLLLISGAMLRGGLLVTYCAQGQFKRNLAKAGFSVETVAGPPGKREMVRAIKI